VKTLVQAKRATSLLGIVGGLIEGSVGISILVS